MNDRIDTTIESRLARRRFGLIAAFVAALALATGCASPPDRSKVEAARAAVDAAGSSGLVDTDSLDYREASRHLVEAQALLEDGKDQALIDHEAEMARLYAGVAVARTEAIAANLETNAYMDRARLSTATTRVAVEVAIQNARSVDSEQTERGLVLTLGGVLFAFDSAELKSDARLSVARVAGFLIALDDRDALIEGYADNTGDAEYNRKLSQRRAESIRDALVESGVSPDRLVAAGYGSRFPVASNDTPEGREQNRRVEIVILKAGMKASDSLR